MFNVEKNVNAFYRFFMYILKYIKKDSRLLHIESEFFCPKFHHVKN